MTAPRLFRFGVQTYSAQSAAAWRDGARRAQDLGYSALHVADHYIGPGSALAEGNHPVQDVAAVPAMAVAAEATDTLRIGCRVFCVDYHRPVVLAKELATLDFFSGGRLEVGLGAGWLEPEYRAMGIPFRPAGQRIELLRETVELVRAHFGDGPVNVHGSQVVASGFEGVPKPAQRPGPPIMIGGGAPKVLGLAGEVADIVSINFNNSSARIGAEGMGSSTAEETARKTGWVRAGAGDRFEVVELEIAAYFTVVTHKAGPTTEAMAGRFGMAPAQFGRHPHVLIGSVAKIVEDLQARRDAYGISYVTVGGGAMEEFAPVVSQLSGR